VLPARREQQRARIGGAQILAVEQQAMAGQPAPATAIASRWRSIGMSGSSA
jgi:hypothetical protein